MEEMIEKGAHEKEQKKCHPQQESGVCQLLTVASGVVQWHYSVSTPAIENLPSLEILGTIIESNNKLSRGINQTFDIVSALPEFCCSPSKDNSMKGEMIRNYR